MTNTKFLDTGEPKRSDVVVFKYPLDTRVDYIKRVVGMPGDRVIYRNKELMIRPKCDEQEGENVPLASRSWTSSSSSAASSARWGSRWIATPNSWAMSPTRPCATR